jgi:hypothetical protein
MDDHPGELVILDLNSECGFDTDNRTPSQSYNRLTEDQWKPIWQKIRDNIRKPCKGFGENRLDDATMNDFIGDGRGCVLTVACAIPGAERDSDKGFYLEGRHNDFSDTDNYNYMREDQISKLKLNCRLGPEDDPDTADDFFILSWIMTLKASDAITPLSDRAAVVLGTLFWYAYREFTPFSYPNVLYVDFVGQPYLLAHGASQEEYMEQTTSHLTALAMAVNLQIASQNCHVGGAKL